MEIPAEVTFRQLKSDFIQNDISLRHDRVIIRLGVGDSVEERHVRLDDIAPEIAITERRSFTALVIMLALAAIFAGAAWRVSGPGTMSFLLRVLFGSMAGSCVVAAFVAFARVPTATLKSRAG